MNKRNSSDIQLIPVAAQRASEAIYEQITSLIISGQLKPGDRLPSERAMMEMMGRSRPTIREALRMLERNGLIRIIAGSSGAVVVEPDTRSVEEPLENLLNMNRIANTELLEYRELNEIAAAGWAAVRRTQEDMEQMRQILEQDPDDPADFKAFSQMDIAFHQAVVRSAHNRAASVVSKVMHRMVVNMRDRSYENKPHKLSRSLLSQIRESHLQIYSAIEAQDEDAAREAMRRHMRMFENDLDL